MKTMKTKLRKNRYAKQIRAVKAALKGKNQTEEHRQKISEGVAEWRANDKQKIRAYKAQSKFTTHENGCCDNIATVEIQEMFFDSMVAAAKALGCSKQLISQCVKRPDTFHSARGWQIELV